LNQIELGFEISELSITRFLCLCTWENCILCSELCCFCKTAHL